MWGKFGEGIGGREINYLLEGQSSSPWKSWGETSLLWGSRSAPSGDNGLFLQRTQSQICVGTFVLKTPCVFTGLHMYGQVWLKNVRAYEISTIFK